MRGRRVFLRSFPPPARARRVSGPRDRGRGRVCQRQLVATTPSIPSKTAKGTAEEVLLCEVRLN